jgi:tRNA nucleotidyltransferase (CCA-adding enzyme)
MEVITSHVNADFDTFASMIAAKKLYPEARLVFSGSLEKGLRDALDSFQSPVPIDKLKDIDLDKVTLVILVDVSHPGRIGPFAEVIKRPGVDVHVYDHHPSTPEDVKGSVEVREPYGSNTSVITIILRDRGIKPAPNEATILMTGIYEDTGFLSYPSTTPKDFEAAGYLLSCGADLTAVSDLLRKELTPEEVALLNEFLQAETRYSIGGVEAVIAEAYIEKYQGDLAILAHKIRDIENMECLFLLVDTEDRVHVIARSKNPKADVGRILKAIGGGGHPNAASATLKGITLIQAKDLLLGAMRDNIPPLRTAREIMSFPPITLSLKTTLKEAVEIMRRYGINAAPVVRNGRIHGVITRQVLDKAVYHGLGPAPVTDYMTTEVESVSAGTSIEKIREAVVGHGQRLLPVMEEHRVVGVITRTDLLKLLQEELRAAAGEGAKKVRFLSGLMKEKLPEWAHALLKEAGEVAAEHGFTAYAVGGFVRDLVLRRENLDIDIVIEGGNGIVFAEDFAKRKGAKVKVHHRFKTAVIVFSGGFKLDVATARLEYYERPGALPTVEQSSLKLDLYRRDFIINTLALSLHPERFGELIDFFGAQKDLKEKTIRVLHNLSFIEDPTRMLRAVRFSEKFDFKIGKHTLNLLKNSVKLDVFRTVSGARINDELRNILEEETSAKALKKLSELGLLKLIHPAIVWDKEQERLFERAEDALAWYELLYTKDHAERSLVLLLALTDRLGEEDLASLVKRLVISGKKRLDALSSRNHALRTLGRMAAGQLRKASALYDALSPLDIELILYLMAKAERESLRKAFSRYMTKLRHTETIRELLRRRLDNEAVTREDEEAFAEAFLKKKPGRKKLK